MKYATFLLLLLPLTVMADISGSFTSPAGPQGRENDTELLQSDIKGFQIYVDGMAYFDIDNLLSSTATTFTIIVGGNAKFLTMTTIDTDGRESEVHSDKVDLTGGKGTPDAPFVFQTITITISSPASSTAPD